MHFARRFAWFLSVFNFRAISLDEEAEQTEAEEANETSMRLPATRGSRGSRGSSPADGFVWSLEDIKRNSPSDQRKKDLSELLV